MVEGAGDHGHEVVMPRKLAQPALKVAELPRTEKLVAPRSSGKFHGQTVPRGAPNGHEFAPRRAGLPQIRRPRYRVA